jgi:antitoxin MazE
VKVSKWGNSLAIRLPAELVEKQGLKIGDQVEARISLIDDAVKTERRLKLDEAWKALDKVRSQIKWPVDYKFDRDEANSRD